MEIANEILMKSIIIGAITEIAKEVKAQLQRMIKGSEGKKQ